MKEDFVFIIVVISVQILVYDNELVWNLNIVWVIANLIVSENKPVKIVLNFFFTLS